MKNQAMPANAARLLHAYLLSRQITQKEAAIALGVSGPTINDWLHAKKRPRAAHRIAVAKWTGDLVPVAAWLTSAERAVVAMAKSEAA